MLTAAFEQESINEEIEHLRCQIAGCPSVREDIKVIVEGYLVSQEIFNLCDMEETMVPMFLNYLDQKGIHAKAKRNTCVAAIRKLKTYAQSIEYQGLIEEITECDLDRAIRNKLIKFLIEKGIKSISEIDYDIREQYERYVNMSPEKTMEYVKAMDQVKLHSIKNSKRPRVLGKNSVEFKETALFLLYYPVYEIANAFYYTRDKHELLWDFRIKAPYKMKQQIFYMLMYVLNELPAGNARRARYMLPLKWLYQFCIEAGVEDLERLESVQIEAFREIVAGKVVNVDNSMQIVDNIRKRLFMDAKEINWNANVWYLERFHLPEERLNPSNPVIRLSFLEILNLENRSLLQAYVRYMIGVTDWSIGNIRHKYYMVSDFLKTLDHTEKSVLAITPDNMETYFNGLGEVDLLPTTFNIMAASIFQFYRFLQVKGWIEKPPFMMEYYIKETLPIHHDRCVPKETIQRILQNLHQLPMVLRLMYLNLWCIGLRISEVCTLKGNAYYWKDNAAWVKVYQNKMRTEKTVPIPSVLYDLMVDYITRNQIGPQEYIFKSAKGRAYHSGTFSKQMIENLNAIGISCEEYAFQTHDYRHTVATFLYDHGASIQAARDYLGHEDEQMTMQYLDYMPRKVKAANEKYYRQPGNSLASSLKKGGANGGQSRA